MAVGTVAYAAPEQLMGEQIDGRADQYALAATAFHLLTGSQLFPNSNPAVVISRHLNSLPPNASAHVPELRMVDSVLAAALAKEPDNRFARCTDFAQALAEAGQGVSSSPTAPTKPAPVRPSTSRSAGPQPVKSTQSRSHTRTLVAAAVAVVAVATLALVLVRPWDSASSISTLPGTTETTTAASMPPTGIATAKPPPPGVEPVSEPPEAATPPAPSSTAAGPTPSQPYALPGCTRTGIPVEKPVSAYPTCNRQHWIEGLTWTEWGASGATATGTEQSQNCDPSCATGEMFRNRVSVRFTGGSPTPPDSGCPATVLFYSQMVVAYPDLAEVPFEFSSDYAVVTRYNGMPAIRYNSLDTNCRPTSQL